VQRATFPSASLLFVTLILGCSSDSSGPDVDTQTLPMIEYLGITIGEYDEATGLAGDITFQGGETFLPFAKLLEGENGPKRSPELAFFVAEGTAVRAPITGVISQIGVIYSGDNFIALRQDGTDWMVSVEHVVNPLVRVGDVVQAGQIIATATPEETPFGTIAFTELAVWLPADSDDELIKMCPYLAFDADLKRSFSSAIFALAQSWEAYWGEDVFQEQDWTQPGCLRDQMTEAEGRNPSS
jgi:Peptidase family M23